MTADREDDAPFTTQEFQQIRDALGGWHFYQIAAMLKWDEREVRRWMAGTNKVPIPKTVVTLLRSLGRVAAQAPKISELAWEEWREARQSLPQKPATEARKTPNPKRTVVVEDKRDRGKPFLDLTRR